MGGQSYAIQLLWSPLRYESGSPPEVAERGPERGGGGGNTNGGRMETGTEIETETQIDTETATEMYETSPPALYNWIKVVDIFQTSF